MKDIRSLEQTLRNAVASVKEMKLKKHGYPPKSVFRRELNIFCRLVTDFEQFGLVVRRKVINLLSCS
jgi:hypothetical protein